MEYSKESSDGGAYKKTRFSQIGQQWLQLPLPDSQSKYLICEIFVTAIASITRLYRIDSPSEVVFDEVHFGKFASWYLQRTFFFDLHPPMAKLLFAFLGWFVGYDGSFEFDSIGESYTNVKQGIVVPPYLLYRSFNALLGIMTVIVMFKIMKQLNYKAITCTFGSLLVAVDNAQILSSRLIMLDAILVFNITLAIYCYIRFYKCQLGESFTFKWYFWLVSLGVSLSLVISTKYVGVFTYGAIGTAVMVNLWQLLDVRSNLSLRIFMRNLIRRLNLLIFVPFMIYLVWFAIHFKVLIYMGDEDTFMSEQFQDTLLHKNPGENNMKQIDRTPLITYYDVVTIQHPTTGAFLTSNWNHYPSVYEDGRVSSGGQIVFGAEEQDLEFSSWEIVPLGDDTKRKNNHLLLDTQVRLRHVATDSFLMGHDVASPLFDTNEEVTTVPSEELYDDDFFVRSTVFKLKSLREVDTGHVVRANRTMFRIYHVDSDVSLWTQDKEVLPEWADFQQEVDGNSRSDSYDTAWLINEVVSPLDDQRRYIINGKQDERNDSVWFFTKWTELQIAMFSLNNELTSEHPFASEPYLWPGSLNGVLFWNADAERRQIYFIGNIVGWWIQVISICVFMGLISADMVTRRRGIHIITPLVRDKIYGPLMFLFMGWCWHYFPFYLMSRQKFLHHYLPAHMIASLLSAGIWETVSTDFKSHDKSQENRIKQVKLTIIFTIFSAALLWCFTFFAPVTYGLTSLLPDEVAKRNWFNIELAYASQ